MHHLRVALTDRCADYAGRLDPNTQFLGTQSLHGGGDPTRLHRGLRALLSWLGRRRGRTSAR